MINNIYLKKGFTSKTKMLKNIKVRLRQSQEKPNTLEAQVGLNPTRCK